MTDTPWFAVFDREKRGPFTTDSLIGELSRVPDSHAVLVWKEGLSTWMRAGEVSELARRLPPVIPSTAPATANLDRVAAQPPAVPHQTSAAAGPQANSGLPTPEQKRKYNVLSFVWGVPGITVQMWGMATNSQVRELHALGTVLLIVGLAYYAKSKGQHPAWGLAGLASCIGVLALAILKDRTQSGPARKVLGITVEADGVLRSSKKPSDT